MPIRNILVPSTSPDDTNDRLAAALQLSLKLDSHFRLLFTHSEPEQIRAALPDVLIAAGVTNTQLEETGRRQAEQSRTQFQVFCEKAGIRSDGRYIDLHSVFGLWREQVGDVEHSVALAARVSDLVIINRPTVGDTNSSIIFDAAVFSGGRPTLVLGEHLPDDLLRHLVIAWNGSLEATRLVGHSLDLLRQAGRVSILTAETERSRESGAASLQDYLMWHGVRAHLLAPPETGTGIGAGLLQAASRVDATMLLMGAYTHSRMHEFLLGGVTRHVLDHAEIPILMEH